MVDKSFGYIQRMKFEPKASWSTLRTALTLKRVSFLHYFEFDDFPIIKELVVEEGPMENIAQSFYAWYRQTLRTPKYRWLIVAGTLLYLFSPIDIAPDFIPVIGWIDDAAIATLLIAEISQLFFEFVNDRKASSSTNATQPTDVEAISVDVN